MRYKIERNLTYKINSMKIISLSLLISLVFMLVAQRKIVYATGESIVLGDEKNPPQVSVEYMGTTPKYPVVGEDIELTYKITANKFNHTIPSKQKEIALLIDRSSSMNWCSDDPSSVDRDNTSHTHYGASCRRVEIEFNTGNCKIHKNEKLPHNNYEVCNTRVNNYCVTHKTNATVGYSHNGGWCNGGSYWNKCEHNEYYSHYIRCTEPILNNYCNIHETGESHNKISSVCNASRLDMTKYAAINFINKLSDIDNLKITLVTYDGNAVVNNPVEISKKINENIDENLINRNNLINKIKDINTIGSTGTNPGEGIRRAAFALGDSSRESTINRSIVMMTDGQPTVYSKGSNNGYYSSIDNREKPDRGNSESFAYTYAKDIIATQIPQRKYNNIYSIGYALGEKGQGANAKMESIHTSMGGSQNTFYATQGGAIDDIFNQIAENLILDYKFDAEINFQLNNKFQVVENIKDDNGKQSIAIPMIGYELKEGTTNEYLPNGKDPKEEIYVKFKVKATSAGTLELFNNSKITYIDVNGNKNDVLIDSPKIEVHSTPPIPIIEANLSSPEVIESSNGEEIEVKYTINPEPFEYIANNNTDDKEVVFLVDTSSSMNVLDKVKNALVNRMINAFLNNGSKIKFNIITYNSDVEAKIIDSEAKDQNGAAVDYRNELQNTINSISKSNSNERKLGQAILEADKFFEENSNSNSIKNIIIIASGEPTDELPEIHSSKYNVLSLAINSQSTYENKYPVLKSWHLRLGGEELGYFISSSSEGNNDIDSRPSTAGDNPLAPNGDIMAVIAEKLKGINYKGYSFNDIKLNFDLDGNFDVINGLNYVGGNVYDISIPRVKYTAKDKVSDTRYIYEAAPFEISFTISPKEGKRGELRFAQNSSNSIKNYVSYTKLDSSQAKNTIERTPIIIVSEEPSNDSNITIQVRDSKGNLDDKYDSTDNTSDDLVRYDKSSIKNQFNKDYKLYGDSYADIVFSGKTMNHLKYKIIDASSLESGQTPTFPNEWDGEVTVGSNGDGSINGDVGNQGYLTQKSYDVSHLPQYGSNSYDLNWLTQEWTENGEPFTKDYYEGVVERPAGTSVNGDRDGYVKQVNYVNPETGETEIRWVPQTVFTEYCNVGGTYKEASKTWGYLKVNQSGIYKFKSRSDDGLRVTLTSNNEEIKLVDYFTVHGPAWSNEVSVELDSSIYYPIFMEYFNCGAEAAYNLQYSGPDTNGNFINIPANTFWSSKSKNPGESSDNGFTGESGIKFPEKQGTYYIAYEAGSKVEEDFTVEKQGVYGPFIVQNRFILTREIENNNNAELQLNYKIQPNDIDFTDIYRTQAEINSVGEKYITQFDIINMQLSDKIPSELKIVEQIDTGSPKFSFPENIINGQLAGAIDGRVLYKLDNSSSNKTEWKYKADDIIISLRISIGEDELQINFGEKDGKLIYDDIQLNNGNRHKKEDYFYPVDAIVEESSSIISQGLFNGKTVQDSSSINITSGNWYTIGTRLKINSSNSAFDITLPYGSTIDENNIYIYEATNGVIDRRSKYALQVNTLNDRLNISNTNNNTILTKVKEYIVVYSIKFNKAKTQFVNSSIDRDRNRKLDFNIKETLDLF